MRRPAVLIFAGSDPSGGAGLQADVQAVAAHGAHGLTVVTALTVQDNERVHSVHPVPAMLVRQQAQALIDRIDIAAVKIGIPGSVENAQTIADLLRVLKQRQPALPVVLDPVLASGHGDALSTGDALAAITTLLPLATLVTPNLPEAIALCNGERRMDAQAETLLRVCPHVLIKGGHGSEPDVVVDTWFGRDAQRNWKWPRLDASFHGTGCTLASAVSALLATGSALPDALDTALAYSHRTLVSAYAIAHGQCIPDRRV